jgi:protoporphyrinogen oxidase
VIGAGPSGLCVGMFLEHDVEVLESRDEPGGTAGSTQHEGFTFDHGPHIMFSRHQHVLDFMVATLGDNVHRCRRKNQIAYGGRLLKYPFENDLAALPRDETFECVRDYFINPWRERHPEPANLREWFLHHFGTALCEKYLFPYNEKVWNVPVEELSMLWAERIPQPAPEDVLKSALGVETEGYLHQLYYHYPLHGGYQAISEEWARQVRPRYGFEVCRIARSQDGGLVVSDGTEELFYDRVVSTMPIPQLLDALDFDVPDRVREAAGRLLVNPMLVVSLGIAGQDPEQRTAVYFADPAFRVNRISYPATFSPHNAPDGCHSIQAEITCRLEDAVWSWPDSQAVGHVVDGLVDAGLLESPDSIVVTHVERRRWAYVVYTQGYERDADVVRTWCAEQGIDLCGRFGYFEYVNVDGAILRAMEVAGRHNGRPVELAAPRVV